MLTKRRIIAAKIETTEGTAESLANADGGIIVFDPKVDVDIKMVERNTVQASLSRLAKIAGAQMAKITFRAEIKGPGSTYSASNVPALGKYLRACGFYEVVDTTGGSEKVTYKPASPGSTYSGSTSPVAPSLTISCYQDGVIKTIRGARGNVKFSGKAGEPFYADFEFTGVWNGLSDGALLAPTYESTIPPVFVSATFTVDSYAAILQGIELDMANTVALRNSVNTAEGYLSAIITGRDPGGKFDPEMVIAATYDWFTKWKTSGAEGAMNIGNLGSTQYNRYKITAPKVTYTKISEADREGVDVADISFQLAQNSADDEIVIEFS